VARSGYGRAAVAALISLVALAAGLGLQASSAGTSSPKTYSAALAPSCVDAGTTTRMTLTLTNTSSQQQLGSANLYVGSGSPLSFPVPATTQYADATQSTSTTLALRNLGIPAHGSLQVPVDVVAPATGGGPYSWTVVAKQSNDFNGPPGNNFATATLNQTSVCAPTLSFGNQPASAVVNSTITDTPYASGNPVTVTSTGFPDGTTVTLNVAGGQQDCGTSTSFNGASAAISGGVATFGSLKGTSLGLGCELYAQAGSTTSSNSNPFNVTLTGITCSTSCQDGVTFSDGTQLTASGQTTGNFHFFALTSASIPASVTQSGGCANFSPLGATVFDQSDGNTSGTGSKTFRYFVPKAIYTKKFSWNSGQPFIPICAGGERVVGSQLVRCTNDPNGGWWGKTLDSKGAFKKGGYAQAVCDPSTGLWWGILASFQDLGANPNIVQGVTPMVTGWGSTNSARYFDINVPAPWDWRAGT
jgi:hypothetical protein